MMASYQVGQTPLREVLNRLAADGLIAAEDQHQRYHKLAAQRVFPHRAVKAEHQAILDVVLRRDAAAAVARLVAHNTATADIIMVDSDLPP